MAQKLTSFGVCQACKILGRDITPKPITWCVPCGKWKCDACLKGIRGLARSGVAFVKNKLLGVN